jgi:hypothetical protein
VAEGDRGASGPATGVKPGALTALLEEVAATPEQREAEPAPLAQGTVIGRFEVLRELGRGGFGVVYEARDRDLGRQVALKIVRPGRATLEEGKVTREAEAIARLAHANLVTLHDVGRSEHGPYLVFELLRGKTLEERIEDGPLPLQEAVHIATEVARGLAHSHAEGVIHRERVRHEPGAGEDPRLRDGTCVRPPPALRWNAGLHGAGAVGGRSGG